MTKDCTFIKDGKTYTISTKEEWHYLFLLAAERLSKYEDYEITFDDGVTHKLADEFETDTKEGWTDNAGDYFYLLGLKNNTF